MCGWVWFWMCASVRVCAFECVCVCPVYVWMYVFVGMCNSMGVLCVWLCVDLIHFSIIHTQCSTSSWNSEEKKSLPFVFNFEAGSQKLRKMLPDFPKTNLFFLPTRIVFASRQGQEGQSLLHSLRSRRQIKRQRLRCRKGKNEIQPWAIWKSLATPRFKIELQPSVFPYFLDSVY